MTILNRVSSQVILNSGAGSAAAAAEPTAVPGQALFGTNVGPGTFTWVVPKGVKSISAVAIGGGGGGGYIPGWGPGGGGGGGLGWRNNIAVQPGQSITVVVGSGGSRYSFGAYPGGESYVLSSSTVKGGAGGWQFGSGFTTYTGDGGGNGGNSYFFQSPGNGAGGYTGDGGAPSTPSFGWGGGGGCSYSSFGGTAAGGGTGLRGTQVPPAGFGSSTVYFYTPYSGYTSYTGFGNGGGGGAGGGGYGDWGQTPWTTYGNGSRQGGSCADGGLYGGGGGGWGFGGFNGWGGGSGAQGGCRIIWGKDRAFPGTLTDDV